MLEEEMQVSQNFYGAINTVNTVEGTLTINGASVLTPESNSKDLVRALRAVRPQLAQIANADAAATRALSSFDAAVSEADSPKPNGEVPIQFTVRISPLPSNSSTASFISCGVNRVAL